MGTWLVCNAFLVPFYQLPVQKREREKEGVLTVQNSVLLSLIRSVLGSSKGSTCSNKAANIEEASAKLQLIVN